MEENERRETDAKKYEIVETEEGDESRRSFMKKGALASGALALGLSSMDSAAAQDGGTNQVLVFTYEYYPNTPFTVTQPLQASTTVNVLRRPGGGTVPEISQPDDYNGYVINYRLGGGGQAAGITTLLFTRDTLNTNNRYRLAGNAQVFSSQLNLLSTTARRAGGGN